MDQNISDSKSHIWEFFTKILFHFRTYNSLIFVHTFQWTLSDFFNFSIFSQKFSKPTKTCEKFYSFYNTVLLRKPHSFYEPQLTRHWKKYALATQPKTFLTLQIFQSPFFCLVSEKTFALLHFLTCKNCILEALWKQMFVYSCTSP